MSTSCDVAVSICIATHNKAAALSAVLRSIFEQKQPGVQVVVIDDGSTDGTAGVCANYPLTFRRIERPGGYRNPACARNRAIREAFGRVLIMQSDDVVHGPGAIARLRQCKPDEMLFATVWNTTDQGIVGEEYTGLFAKRPLFFLGAVHAEHLWAIGGNDEDFHNPGYEDNYLADCLIHGRLLRSTFLAPHEAKGFHLDHPRPDPNLSGYYRSQALYRVKVKEARETGVWKARIGL